MAAEKKLNRRADPKSPAVSMTVHKIPVTVYTAPFTGPYDGFLMKVNPEISPIDILIVANNPTTE